MEAAVHPSSLSCSIVIPTWKRPHLLREVLASLARQSATGFEVVVVSDGEDTPTRELADSYSAAFSISWQFHAENRGQAAARNTGARSATGDIVLFLDDDTPACETLVESHLQRHKNATGIGPIAVVGKIIENRIDPVTRATDRFLQRNWERSLELYAVRLSDTSIASIAGEFETTLSFGLNSSISRAVFLQHGGFNEALRITDEDNEFGIRLYTGGVQFVFEPTAIVTHRSDKDLTDYLKSCWRQSGRSDVTRALGLHEKNAQTRRLVALCEGGALRRASSKISWHSSNALCAIADRLESAANAANSKLFLKLWGRIAADACYWESVKATGCTLDQLEQAAGRRRVALMLHSISDPLSPAEKSYYVSPQRFRSFMQRFLSRGYRTATLQNWLDDAVAPRQVLLTFDDAYDDLYEHLLPLVIEHRLTPVIFVVTDRIGETNLWDQASGLRSRNLLTLGQIREMQKYGVLFGSHSLSHPALPTTSDQQLLRETLDSRLKLQDLLGCEIVSFAYPYGEVDQRVRSAVVSAGYKVAFTTLPGPNWWNDPFSQRRADINEYTSKADFSFSLDHGQTRAQSVSAALRELEQSLPTSALRSLAHGMRVFGRQLYLGASSESERRA